ncbi:hypothetical protein VP01_11670g1, partial [Puccinia sorghi]
ILPGNILPRGETTIGSLSSSSSFVYSGLALSSRTSSFINNFLGLNLTQLVIRFIPMLVLGLLLNITFGVLSHIIPAQLLMVLGYMGTAIRCLLSAIMDTSASYWTYNFASFALSVVELL